MSGNSRRPVSAAYLAQQEAESERAMRRTLLFTCPVPGCGGEVELGPDWMPGNARPICKMCAVRAGDPSLTPAVIAERDATIRGLRAELEAVLTRCRKAEARVTVRDSEASVIAALRVKLRETERAAHSVPELTAAVETRGRQLVEVRAELERERLRRRTLEAKLGKAETRLQEVLDREKLRARTRVLRATAPKIAPAPKPVHVGPRPGSVPDAVLRFVAQQLRPVRLADILAGVPFGTPGAIQQAASKLRRDGKLKATPLPKGSGKGRPVVYEVAP